MQPSSGFRFLLTLVLKAASLGIDPSNPEASTSASPYVASGYRPYRGRGRGRGRGAYGYRGGRGGPPPNMRLDNRPRRLLVKEVAPDVQQAVRDWYEATGQVESFEPTDDGDVVVSFRTRIAAEQVRVVHALPSISYSCNHRRSRRVRTYHLQGISRSPG